MVSRERGEMAVCVPSPLRAHLTTLVILTVSGIVAGDDRTAPVENS